MSKMEEDFGLSVLESEESSLYSRANFDKLMSKLEETRTVYRSQLALLQKNLTLMKEKNQALHKTLIVKENQLDYIARNFPNVHIPVELDHSSSSATTTFTTTHKTPTNRSQNYAQPPNVIQGRGVFPLSQVQPVALRPQGGSMVFPLSGAMLSARSTQTSRAASPVSRVLQMSSARALSVTPGTSMASLGVRSSVRALRTTNEELKKEVDTLKRNLKQSLAVWERGVMAGVADMTGALREKLRKEASERRKLHNELQELRGNVRVWCRVRGGVSDSSGSGCVKVLDEEKIETFPNRRIFGFDRVFNDKAKNGEIARDLLPFVVSVLDGFNVCVFAYGQTGSGKTHSMQGSSSEGGVYDASIGEVFRLAEERTLWRYEKFEFSVTEIYNEEIRDLLRRPGEPELKLQLRQKPGALGFHVPGLTWLEVKTAADAMKSLANGSRNRAIGAHDMNAQSSRSHLIVQLRVAMKMPSGRPCDATLTLVDLAGSERLNKTNATGDTQKESIFINKSLSALGDVINAKANKAGHIPYRNSTLTSLLADNLSADSKTLMLLQINPDNGSADESLNSLVFASRVALVELRQTTNKR